MNRPPTGSPNQPERNRPRPPRRGRLINVGPGHPDTDRRTLQLTRLTVEKIDRNPALVRTGLDNIARWARRNGDLPACHAEWKTIIEQRSWNDIRALLLADSDEGQRLRSTHPFIGIISDEERAAIHAA